ncbi:hypothetical protein BDV93DRAFT_504540 [Ceratobasidium sp. AG-I]|nr:hypothetical protein BDV93DRAFT_504540 [Ceratobasidium sp. AG-I]
MVTASAKRVIPRFAPKAQVLKWASGAPGSMYSGGSFENLSLRSAGEHVALLQSALEHPRANPEFAESSGIHAQHYDQHKESVNEMREDSVEDNPIALDITVLIVRPHQDTVWDEDL